ncbi:DUF1830 domain-containing protein [Acaryochloris marina]|uniref:DUF1830 domain-containing protein n=1 Tax=Acaryochloris marina (strain MBIC 11017) TaxID=329726 RepID=B0CAR7_ACAM1|nr:DUF1830 domain-containing protein [Acaryochloris marina]ABW30268.1 conserved hypothetical protein [Acaryochloris marina MBIC11017]BDM79095.1 hypothetical protein AM10699_19630 [Acaryochloris marina MBIC10699]
MIKTLESQPTQLTFCSYCNPSPRVQVVRITNIKNWYFERVVFPQQTLVFDAPRTAHLEIHSSEIATAIQVDCIPCRRLAVKTV